MNLHAQIELFGGPEDGRQITLPVGTEGIPLSPLPVQSSSLTEAGPDHDSPEHEQLVPSSQDVAWYERYQHRGRGIWVYKYANFQSAYQHETT